MRLKKKDQVLKFAKAKGYNEDQLKFLSYHLDICRDGWINDYVSKLPSISSKIFPEEPSKCFSIYPSLVEDKVLVLIRAKDLHILWWDLDFLHVAGYDNKQARKRKYTKDPIKNQQSIVEFIQLKYAKYLPAPSEPPKIKNLEGCKVTMSYLLEGVKIPSNIFVLFSGLPMTDKDLKEIKKNLKDTDDPEEIKAILKNQAYIRNLNKEDKRLLYGYCSVCNTRGIINDFKVSDVIEKLREIFDDGTIAESTVHECHKKLKRIGIVRELTQLRTGQTTLEICNYNNFGKGNRYVILPYAVFKRAFKKLQAAGMKLFFEWVFRLNNGEGDNKTGSGKDKALYFKAARSDFDTPKQKKEFQDNCRWLRKRCRSEIQKVIMGDADFKALQEFFDIGLNNNNKHYGYIEVRIKQDYFIGKKQAERLKAALDPLERYQDKAEYIKGVLKDYCRFDYTEEDLKSFTRTLHRAGKKVIFRMLRTLDIIIRDKEEFNKTPVKCKGAYLNKLYDVYRHGDRTELYRRTFNYYKEMFAAAAELEPEDEDPDIEDFKDDPSDDCFEKKIADDDIA